eukprot:381121-Prymnesium_polylepis.1
MPRRSTPRRRTPRHRTAALPHAPYAKGTGLQTRAATAATLRHARVRARRGSLRGGARLQHVRELDE